MLLQGIVQAQHQLILYTNAANRAPFAAAERTDETMAHASDKRTTGTALSLEVSAAVYHGVQALHDHVRYRATRRALARLDPSVLADLGLTRQGIRAAAREAVYGR
jgi:uncharacterized protein YjiS (DUF1127 family)